MRMLHIWTHTNLCSVLAICQWEIFLCLKKVPWGFLVAKLTFSSKLSWVRIPAHPPHWIRNQYSLMRPLRPERCFWWSRRHFVHATKDWAKFLGPHFVFIFGNCHHFAGCRFSISLSLSLNRASSNVCKYFSYTMETICVWSCLDLFHKTADWSGGKKVLLNVLNISRMDQFWILNCF